VELHHLRVDIGQRQRGALAPGRADRAKEIGVLVALIGGLARTRSTLRPLPDNTVLLSDAGFVLEPDFDGRLWRQMSEMRLQRGVEVFL
jgi:hypothetical protein